MRDYPHVLARIVNTPLLAHPGKAETVAGVVLRQAGVAVAVEQTVHLGPVQERALRTGYARWGEKPYLFAEGIAVVEVTGSLAHRQWHIGKSSGVMGYDGIGAQLDAALDDPEVKGVLFDVHSAGGEAHGAFALADRIAAARRRKPMAAVADEMALSAAYLLAAATGEVWLAAETAQAGSIGAVWVHFSFEAFLKAEGIKPTIFQSGARKAEGNPYQDIPPAAAARIQAEVDAVGELFVGRLARWGRLAAEKARGTEAGTYLGEAAVRLGLADGIAPAETVFAALAEKARRASPT